MRDVVRLILASCVVLTVGACGDDDGGGGTPDAPPAVETGDYHEYVLSTLTLPTQATATTLAFDLDGIAGTADNKLGSILSLIPGDLQGQIDLAVMEGTIVLLSAVRADTLTSDDSVSWQVWLGNTPEPPAPPTAGATYTIDPAGPTDAKVVGGLDSAGTFEGRGGIVSLSLPLVPDAPALELTLYGASIRAKVTEAEFLDTAASDKARLGGALRKKDVDDKLIPAIAALVTSIINDDGSDADTDPDCVCASGTQTCAADSTAAQLAELFEQDPADCTVTTAEVMMSAVYGFLSPDVDLFKGPGPCTEGDQTGCDKTGEGMVYAPGQEVDGDGFDSLSLGLGIRGLQAVFARPGE